MKFKQFLFEGLYDWPAEMMLNILRKKHQDVTPILDKLKNQLSLIKDDPTKNKQKAEILKAISLVLPKKNEKSYIVSDKVSEEKAKKILKWAKKGLERLEKNKFPIPDHIYIITKEDNVISHQNLKVKINNSNNALASIVLTPSGYSALVLRADNLPIDQMKEFHENVYQRGYLSTDDEYHTLNHEMGHYECNKRFNFDYNKIEKLSNTKVPVHLRRIIQDELSIAAKQNLAEFYAEMYAGKMYQDYSPELEELYKNIKDGNF